jgi:trans-2-enoyl-CoA reductase
LIRVPKEINAEQAAMLRVNPPTAYRMLHDFIPLNPGEWIVQYVANSGVGRAVIQLAAAKGWRTVYVVRRPELIPELRSIGANSVLVESPDLAPQIGAATGGKPVRLGLNAVGGESALRIANSLAPGGTLVTYGAMGRQPIRIPNGLLIFKNLSFRGFWVTQWFRDASAEARDAMFAELFELAQSGRLNTPVDQVFPLEEINAALKRADEGGRSGKVLLTMQK